MIQDYQPAVQAAGLCASMLAQWDLQELLAAIDRAETVGPLLDPTTYREKATAMKEDKELLKAAMPLWRLGRKLQGREVPS